jgi:hypothetical protein
MRQSATLTENSKSPWPYVWLVFPIVGVWLGLTSAAHATGAEGLNWQYDVLMPILAFATCLVLLSIEKARFKDALIWNRDFWNYNPVGAFRYHRAVIAATLIALSSATSALISVAITGKPNLFLFLSQIAPVVAELAALVIGRSLFSPAIK